MTAARARSSRACGLVDVEQRFEAPDGRQHGQRGLDVDPDVAGVHRDGERLGGRQPGVEAAVDQQAPDVPEGHVTDQVLDVDAAVAERAALLVGFGDLRLERDDSFESGYEVGHRAAPHEWPTAGRDGCCGTADRCGAAVVRGPAGRMPSTVRTSVPRRAYGSLPAPRLADRGPYRIPGGVPRARGGHPPAERRRGIR